jgi:hypothetical protein
MANMYFVLYGYSKRIPSNHVDSAQSFVIDSVTQAQLLLRDLKIGQCKVYYITFVSFGY